jgi:hypothetical protein
MTYSRIEKRVVKARPPPNMVAHHVTGSLALDFKPDDIFWCTADPGWVTGTSYGIISPLTHGITSVIDEADFDAERLYATRSSGATVRAEPDSNARIIATHDVGHILAYQKRPQQKDTGWRALVQGGFVDERELAPLTPSKFRGIPKDAAWLFAGAPPELPNRWHGILPGSAGLEALWVQVEKAPKPLSLPGSRNLSLAAKFSECGDDTHER